MATDVIVLKITKKEHLPEDTYLHQADDGTIFYEQFLRPERLYVKWEGKEIDADLPSRSIWTIGAFGDSLYFTDETRQKIYKAVFTPNNGIRISHVRDLHEGVKVISNFYRRVKHGKEYLYRMCNDPNGKGILHDISTEELAQYGELKFLHRDRAVYLKSTNEQRIIREKVRKRGNNLIVIEGNNITMHYTNDSSPFLHFICANKTIYSVNCDTLDLLPPLRIENAGQVSKIVGVCNGMISLVARVLPDSDYSIITAPMPLGYYGKAIPVNNATLQEVNHNIDEVNREKSVDTIPADNTLDDLVEQCCCSICDESFDSIKFIPRNLVCGHTFCEICINNDKLRTKEGNGRTVKSRVDPKVTCKACNTKFPSSSVCMCNKEDCAMYNQLLCMNCTILGGHGGHVVTYDIKMKKIREKLRDKVTDLCSKIEDKKASVLENTRQILEKNLSELKIPPKIIDQLKTVASEQDADDYTEIVENLAKTIIDECDDMKEAFDSALNSATRHIRK